MDGGTEAIQPPLLSWGWKADFRGGVMEKLVEVLGNIITEVSCKERSNREKALDQPRGAELPVQRAPGQTKGWPGGGGVPVQTQKSPASR